VSRLSGLASRIRLPAHAIYLHWHFAGDDLHDLEFDITVHNDPGPGVGEYFAPFSGSIGGAQAYGGFQTDLYRPEFGGIGKGALFSTWWSFDENDTRRAHDGFIQLGTHEGRFVGVRRAVQWSVGQWRFAFRRSDIAEDVSDPIGDWYICSMTPLRGDSGPGRRAEVAGDEIWVGSMRFPREHGRRAAIGSSFPSFLEVYNEAKTYGDINDWHLDVMAYGNGTRAIDLRTEYPAYPYAEVPNADAWYDAERDRVHARFGRDTLRTHAAGVVF
jgi:hypothetical protein